MRMRKAGLTEQWALDVRKAGAEEGPVTVFGKDE